MTRLFSLAVLSTAILGIAACTPAEQALNKPPGNYESSTSSTDANGTSVERSNSTSVGYDANGNKKAVVKQKVTRDPPGLFNKTTTENALAANAIQAIVYALSTRLGAKGRDPYMLVLVLVIGLMSGWLTIATGGIGASFLGAAITRFAVFLTTGHMGRPAPRGREVEEIERKRRLPDGWQAIGAGESGPIDG